MLLQAYLHNEELTSIDIFIPTLYLPIKLIFNKSVKYLHKYLTNI